MQRSSVYWRYKDKDTLVKAAVAEPFLALLKPLRSLTEPTDSWPELSRALETMMNRVQAEPDTVKAGLLLKMQRWEPPTLGGSAVLEGSSAAEADLASFFGRIVPEEHDGHQVGQDLAWIVARFIDGFMLAPALGLPRAGRLGNKNPDPPAHQRQHPRTPPNHRMNRTHHGNGFRCGDIWTWVWQANDDERPKGTTRSPVRWRTGEGSKSIRVRVVPPATT